MPWYGWVLLVLFVVLAVGALLFRLLRASRRGRRFLALSTRGKIAFGRLLLEDPEVPPPAKLALVLLVGYLALPFDLIPDFVPYLGQADDFLVVFAAISLLIVAVPRDRFDRALALTEREQEAQRFEQAQQVN